MKNAKKLFHTEMNKLVETNMPKSQAASIDAYIALATRGFSHHPILEEGEDEYLLAETDDCTRIYEEKYDGKVPDQMLGISFPKPKQARRRRSSRWDGKSYHESVLKNMTQILLNDYEVQTPRQLLSVEKAEKLSSSV